jgi:hypothetical protein
MAQNTIVVTVRLSIQPESVDDFVEVRNVSWSCLRSLSHPIRVVAGLGSASSLRDH